MKRTGLIMAAGLILASAQFCDVFAAGKVRKIRFKQDDAQPYMVSKVYQLKYIKACDLTPFVLGAVKRYDHNSDVQRLNYKFKKEQFIVVSTPPEMMPMVDDMVKKLDRPGKKDEYGSIVEGTGIYRWAYKPKYRSADEMVYLLNKAVKSGDGIVYRNPDSNIIYWKDSKSDGASILKWAKKLDRPVPQVSISLKVYEVRESTLRDLGIDYLAWKNGPGLNLFSIGYDSLNLLSSDKVLNSLTSTAMDVFSNFNWGYGAFFVAPQFDMSFVRVLQQSGNAKISATANVVMVNQDGSYNVKFTPAYQNIVKDQDNDKSSVDLGASQDLSLTITNPTICFQAPEKLVSKQYGSLPYSLNAYEHELSGSVLFDYSVIMNSVVERNNFGQELTNSSYVDSDLTLEFKTEKLLATWGRETEAEQTIGIPFLCEIPVLKYLFGSTTTIKEKVLLFVTAEANLVHPEASLSKFAGRVLSEVQMTKIENGK